MCNIIKLVWHYLVDYEEQEREEKQQHADDEEDEQEHDGGEEEEEEQEQVVAQTRPDLPSLSSNNQLINYLNMKLALLIEREYALSIE